MSFLPRLFRRREPDPYVRNYRMIPESAGDHWRMRDLRNRIREVADEKIRQRGRIDCELFSRFIEETGFPRDLSATVLVERIGLLEEFYGNIDLHLTPITSLDNLRYVGGTLDINSGIFSASSLQNLEYVGNDLNASLASVTAFPSLVEVRHNAQIGEKTRQLPKLKKVGGSLEFIASRVEELPELEVVEGDLKLSTHTQSLPRLRKVGGTFTLLLHFRKEHVDYPEDAQIGFLNDKRL